MATRDYALLCIANREGATNDDPTYKAEWEALKAYINANFPGIITGADDNYKKITCTSEQLTSLDQLLTSDKTWGGVDGTYKIVWRALHNDGRLLKVSLQQQQPQTNSLKGLVHVGGKGMLTDMMRRLGFTAKPRSRAAARAPRKTGPKYLQLKTKKLVKQGGALVSKTVYKNTETGAWYVTRMVRGKDGKKHRKYDKL